MGIKTRNSSLDIIRIMAFFFVLSVHFFYHNGFYYEQVVGYKMYIATIIRSFFMVCVPLFIILSGYLMKDKKCTKNYYKKIWKTIILYILASIFCLLYKTLFLNMSISLSDGILSILNFTAAPYAWYVEMYIGLYLIIPFINVMWRELKDLKERKFLIFIFIFLTSCPGIVNIKYQIIPDWWSATYPIMYYLIGCYLAEYKLPITRKLNVHLLFAVLMLNGLLNCYLSYGKSFRWGIWQDWGAFPNLLLTVLMFNLILNIDTSRLDEKIKVKLAKISNLCFVSYLVSWIFDSFFYTILNQAVQDVLMRMKYYIFIVPTIFICSLLLSYCINTIYKWMLEIYLKLIKI